MTEAQSQVKNTRTLVGRVVSDAREKTVTVLVERRAKHELYGKIVAHSRKYHAHDENNEFAIGDVVRLLEFRQGHANLVEITLPDNTPWGGRPVRKLNLPRDVALVTILRGQRVIVPEPDEPLEGGDELLFVAAPQVEKDLRTLLAEGRG